MLFVQGTRDGLADLARIRAVVAKLALRATLMEIAEATMPSTCCAVQAAATRRSWLEVLDGMAAWMRA